MKKTILIFLSITVMIFLIQACSKTSSPTQSPPPATPTPSPTPDASKWHKQDAGERPGAVFGHSIEVFGSKVYIIGGKGKAGEKARSVYASADMKKFSTSGARADLPKNRRAHASCVYDGKLWAAGGIGEDKNALADVLYTKNGVTFTAATKKAEFGKRYGFIMLAHRGEVWAFSGTDGKKYYNDLWSSDNGKKWRKTEIKEGASFMARSFAGGCVYKGRMWLIGGKKKKGVLNDVWRSRDGTDWEQVTSNAAFSPRQGHSVLVYKDRLFVIGGRGGGRVFNDVWRSIDGREWTLETESADFAGRDSAGAVVFNGKLWLYGGRAGREIFGDIWWAR